MEVWRLILASDVELAIVGVDTNALNTVSPDGENTQQGYG
jgi:hypothetical protein